MWRSGQRQKVHHSVSISLLWSLELEKSPKEVRCVRVSFRATRAYTHFYLSVILIISPFNYPLWLSLIPVVSEVVTFPEIWTKIWTKMRKIGAIAAGNAVLLKPSENSSTMSTLFAELAPKYMDSDLFRVVNGAVPETTKVLNEYALMMPVIQCSF